MREAWEHGLDSLFPDVGEGRKVLIEFVSSNPTGPLHIGHGRGAAVGDVLANILLKTGYNVVKEYYVNDAGKQIDTLGQSTYARWKELRGDPVPFEEHYYQGDYVKEIASLIVDNNIPVPTDAGFPHKSCPAVPPKCSTSGCGCAFCPCKSIP